MKKSIFSVSNKSGIVEFARELCLLNYEILSTSGTFQLLNKAGIVVQKIEAYTGSPELLGGKVKTLHPKVFAGILGNPNEPSEIPLIHLVVANLYPLENAEIDIGGCALLRAAAKNYENVIVVCDPKDYSEIIDRIKTSGMDRDFRRKLAAKAFQLTAEYDSKIAASLTREKFPDKLTLSFCKKSELAYGENPFQEAALYLDSCKKSDSAVTALQLQGKPLTFNNILDADSALEIVKKFEGAGCVIVKHNNPCAVAEKQNCFLSFTRAYAADPLCAFGGIVAFNQKVDLATAQAIGNQFFELIIAPGYDEDALCALSAKKNLRVLKTDQFIPTSERLSFKEINGGLLYQTLPVLSLGASQFQVVTQKQPTNAQMEDLIFAAKVNQEVKSNSIVIAKEKETVGIGAGQMSRVDSTFIALYKAKEKASGAVLSSDGFFPFADSIEMAGKAGIAAIIQPGGSKNDQEVIRACNRFGIAMVFTGKRLFKH
jgi:phosphoribosylaminoimidazolecarboxamide formyltransferase/IMP cyclohydrolase